MCKERRVARHRTPHLNGRQRLLLLRFTYVNDRVQQASERIQPGALIEIARSIGHEAVEPAGRPRDAQKGHVMFRKIAIALVAPSVLTAPVLAQGTTPAASKVSPTIPPPTPSTPDNSQKPVTNSPNHPLAT